MSTQKYDLQREKLLELKKFLGQFDSDMLRRLQEFKSKIQQLGQIGLPVETMNKLNSELLQITEGLIKRNSEFIQTQAIPFVGKNIEMLENLITMNKFR